MKHINKNDRMMELLQKLKKTAIDNNAPIWKRVATDLEAPTKARRLVNVYKIEKYVQDGETIVVPGKVLGTGDLTKKVTVAAFSFSEDAHKKISAKGKTMTITELMHKNPKGEKVRIIG
jgi:large subunit ribosomal protein L18e